jgi:histidyl-tRNA synthetase
MNMALNTQPYKGARDFYPAEKRLQNYIFGVWRNVVESYGYEEYDAPIIEPLEIYQAKTSDEIVNEQTYVFEDRGGRKVTLRPEMTPTVSRMVAGKRQELAYPLRWYSIPNLWRYERPQRGRLREHWQLNVDLFGVEGITGDIELILIADTIMQRFGAPRNSYSIRLNSRQFMNHIFNDYLGLDSEMTKKVAGLIDKMHKMPEADFNGALQGILGDSAPKLLSVLQANDFQSLPEELRQLPAASRLHDLEMILGRQGITNARFDITLMRGFDYYTDIVFEIFDTNPENSRSLFGGGRYDGLVGLFGVEPVPTVGFGMGDVTIKDFLETHRLLPKLSCPVNLATLLVGDVYEPSLKVIEALRNVGLKVAVDSTGRKMDNQIKSAFKAGYPYVLFIGESELQTGMYHLKELDTGQEYKLTLDEIIQKLKG